MRSRKTPLVLFFFLRFYHFPSQGFCRSRSRRRPPSFFCCSIHSLLFSSRLPYERKGRAAADAHGHGHDVFSNICIISAWPGPSACWWKPICPFRIFPPSAATPPSIPSIRPFSAPIPPPPTPCAGSGPPKTSAFSQQKRTGMRYIDNDIIDMAKSQFPNGASCVTICP